MSKIISRILNFYLTLAVPLLYFAVLYTVSLGGTIFVPLFFRLFGLALSFFGITFWILSYFHLGKSFGVLPQNQKKVNRGLYHYYKHPMYIGIFFTFFGLALANESRFGLLTTCLILLPVLFFRARLEESKLRV
jgi:protein-S-isoprenylcysteine O-methyltransferase Ste14